MRYHLTTLGCAKNTVDSIRLERTLRNLRHTPVTTPDLADLILVNTCGFIDAAKDESIQTVKTLESARRPNQQLYVIGCMTQIAATEVRTAVPNITATYGAEAWEQIAADLGPASDTYDIPQPSPSPLEGEGWGERSSSAYLKISDGCDRPCTFCIIPPIKGRMHSDTTERLINEARWLAASGVKELVLVAQDSTAYGEDAGQRDGLATFLERLSEAVPHVPWIRLMYAYPGRVTPRLAHAMAALPNIVPYMDMPLQHGSDAVLHRMKRPSLRVARQSIQHVRDAMPDIALRTTFIVGYPGETEREFQELLDFVQEQRFHHIGAFTYSPQPGTPAAQLPQLTEKTKQRRYARLMELAQAISLEHNRALVGQELDVLIESETPTQGEHGTGAVSVGRTHRDAPEVDGLALVKGEYPAGTMIRVRVDGALHYDLLCTPVGISSVPQALAIPLHPITRP